MKSLVITLFGLFWFIVMSVMLFGISFAMQISISLILTLASPMEVIGIALLLIPVTLTTVTLVLFYIPIQFMQKKIIYLLPVKNKDSYMIKVCLIALSYFAGFWVFRDADLSSLNEMLHPTLALLMPIISILILDIVTKKVLKKFSSPKIT